MTEKEFIDALKELNITPSEKQLEQLNYYYELLIEWNEKINLTAITEKKDVYLKHFYDSLTITKVIDLNNYNTLCDVGTGAGFPGIVLKIFFPNLKVTLIDALNKRLIFLNEVIAKLELKDITTIHTRVEEYGVKSREQYEIVVARAVANLPVLLEYLTPIVMTRGYVITMKGDVKDELINSNHAIKELNLNLEKNVVFKLPYENSQRTILLFQKEAMTNSKYPRRYAEIEKRPL
jgi:16S rRNA (guanine527-N7)-methyltransferase